MLTLEKTIRILMMNRKGTGNYKTLKCGDLVTIKFDCNGNGGNSPKVDLYINGTYMATLFARSVNASLFLEQKTWRKGDMFKLPRMVEAYEEVR